MVKGRVKYILLLALIFGVCINANVFADNPVNLSLTVGEVLTLSVPDQPQNISITPTAAGYYDSTNFNITSATNNMTGYTLSMSVANTDLVSNTINVITGEPPVIPTIASSQEGITAEAFAASTDTNILNHYGVSINSGNFNAMPSTSTSIKTTTTTNSASADTTNIALATKLDLNTVPGTYSTTINFAIVVNPLPTPPGTKGGTLDEPSSHPGLNIGGSSNVSFPADSLLRAFELAYVQAGKPLYIATNDTTNYPNGWKPMQSGDTGEVRFAMQDIDMTFTENNVTHSVCEWARASSSLDDSYIDWALVMDIRDGTSYRIIKAADGRCWMQDNLALDLLDSNVRTTMINSPSYTNANSASLTSLFSGNRANGAQYATSGITTYTAEEIPYLSNVEVGDANLYIFSVPLIHAALKDSVNSSDSITELQSSKYGVFYNYCAASAGSYCYGSGTDAGSPANRANTAIDTTYDICPSGWRLPTGGNTLADGGPSDGGEFKTLSDSYPAINGGDNQFTRVRKALLLPLSGWYTFWDMTAGEIWYEGYASGQETYGSFWSSTKPIDAHAYDPDWSMYSLKIKDGSSPQIQLTTAEGRYNGSSVRCINKTGNEPAPSNN